MTIEASFMVENSEFPLSAVFEELSSVTIELDRVVPTTTTAIPYFWIYSDDTTQLTTELSDDIAINQVTVIDQVETGMLVRVDWNLDHESVLTAIINTDVTLLSGRGEGGQWSFDLRARNRSVLAAFQTYCRNNNLSITLSQLHSITPLKNGRPYNLTAKQQRALELLYTRGYFDSPRGVSQQEVSEDLGITRQAVSTLLQRGIRQLIANTLAPDSATRSP